MMVMIVTDTGSRWCVSCDCAVADDFNNENGPGDSEDDGGGDVDDGVDDDVNEEEIILSCYW